MTRKSLLGWLAGAVGLCAVCCVCLGPQFVFLLEIPFRLCAGWAFFGVRFFRDEPPPGLAWLVVPATLAALVGVVHFGCRGYLAVRHSNSPWPWRRSLALVGVPTLVALAGVVANDGVVQVVEMVRSPVPLLGSSFESAPRTQSSNNLKQMGIAAHGFHDGMHQLPAGSTFDEQGRGLHGWQTALLPYLDQMALHSKIDFAQPWNAPVNQEWTKVRLQVYQNPGIEGRESEGYALTHYAGNVHVLGLTPMKLADITDGTSNTMLMGEINANFRPWAMPGNWRDPALGTHRSPETFGGPWKKGFTIIVMCDGTVRGLFRDASPEVLKAIATPRGGEPAHLSVLD